MSKWLILLIAVLWFGAAAASPKIAVVDFDTHQYSGQLAGAQLADYVTDELVNSGLFEVVEREKLDSVVREIGFGQSGMVDLSSASQFGKLLGAGYLMTGRVVSLDAEEKSFSGYGVNTRQSILSLSVSVRIIDVQSGSVRYSTRTRTQRTINEAGGLSVGASNPYAALSEQAAVEVVRAVVESGRFSAGAGEQGRTEAVAPRLVSVTVVSDPPHADVEVDGVFYGNAGGVLRLPEGLRNVSVSLAGFFPWQKKVMISEGAQFRATLVPEQSGK